MDSQRAYVVNCLYSKSFFCLTVSIGKIINTMTCYSEMIGYRLFFKIYLFEGKHWHFYRIGLFEFMMENEYE